MFVTKNRDSSATRPALADYLLLFRKPGDNPVPIKTDVTNDEWIDWAQPVWWNIRETNTLNTTVAREAADERHICPCNSTSSNGASGCGRTQARRSCHHSPASVPRSIPR